MDISNARRRYFGKDNEEWAGLVVWNLVLLFFSQCHPSQVYYFLPQFFWLYLCFCWKHILMYLTINICNIWGIYEIKGIGGSKFGLKANEDAQCGGQIKNYSRFLLNMMACFEVLCKWGFRLLVKWLKWQIKKF